MMMMMMWIVSQPAMTTRLKALQTATAPAVTHDDDDDELAKDADATNDITRYQPLTLAALMDYKRQLAAPGHGQFALGHVQLWPRS